jgi:hypothetical protein
LFFSSNHDDSFTLYSPRRSWSIHLIRVGAGVVGICSSFWFFALVFGLYPVPFASITLGSPCVLGILVTTWFMSPKELRGDRAFRKHLIFVLVTLLVSHVYAFFSFLLSRCHIFI